MKSMLRLEKKQENEPVACHFHPLCVLKGHHCVSED